MRTVPGSTDHVVVVGAGLSGLSAALQLAGQGRSVTVVERYGYPGGRMGQADIRGYKIDTGATVLTMPDIIENAFNAVGASMSDYVELMPSDPAYRASFADGSSLATIDGADPVEVTANGKDTEITVGDDHYLFPAAAPSGVASSNAPHP